jgi:hypothetical protein
MTSKTITLALTAFALAACATDSAMTPVPSGGSAGAQGAAYCETVPSDPADMADWNELCDPDDR